MRQLTALPYYVQARKAEAKPTVGKIGGWVCALGESKWQGKGKGRGASCMDVVRNVAVRLLAIKDTAWRIKGSAVAVFDNRGSEEGRVVDCQSSG